MIPEVDASARIKFARRRYAAQAARFVAVVGVTAACGGCGREVAVHEGDAWDRDPPGVGSLRGRIVTSNTGDDTLSIVDPAGPAAPLRLPVGLSPVELEGPHHIAADREGRHVYVNLSMAVAGSGSGPHGAHGSGRLPGFVLKLDAATAREVGRVQVDANPGDSALGPDGRTLFVTHYDLTRWLHASHAGDIRAGDSNLVAVDVDAMVVRRRRAICPAAHGVRVTPDGRTLYAACGPDEIAVVDLTNTAWPVRRVSLPGTREGAGCSRCPYTLGIAPDGLVWVSNLGPGSRGGIDIYDPGLAGGTFDAGRAVVVRGSAMFAVFTGDATSYRAYVPEQGPAGDWIRVFEPAGPGAPVREIAAIALAARDCLAAHMLLVSPDARRGHLVCEGDRKGPGTFVWLDLGAGSVVGSRALGVFPDGLTLVPEVKAP